ncbi:hypothetical protein [Microbacterium sp. NPDC089695]|uniref:hypothetical protein n=1 Tax=Microbacterium sp. NPDC089695 TaxID=3364198 RepID=UPI00382B3C63
MHRPFPTRKTLGTRYNLKPDTRPVEAQRLQPGDVVVLEPECPTVVTRMLRAHGGVHVWGRYIWEPPHAPHWPLGDFGAQERVARALPGEYRTPPRPTDTNP